MLNDTYEYFLSLSPEDRNFLISNISQDLEHRDYFDKFVVNFTGVLGDNSFNSITTMRVKDLEKLLYRSFLEGLYYNELKNRKQLETLWS